MVDRTVMGNVSTGVNASRNEPDTAMSVLTLAFLDADMERAFVAGNDWENRNFLRFGKALCLVSWISFLVPILGAPGGPHPAMLGAVLGNIAFVSGAIALTFFRGALAYFQRAVAFAVITSMVANLVVVRFGGLPASELPLNAIFYLLFAFFILRLRFWVATSTSVVVTGLYLLAPLVAPAGPVPADGGQGHVAFALVCLVIGGYLLERNARNVFVQKKIIDARNRDLAAERERSERLLLNVLPEDIARRLKGDEATIADQFDGVSILFADVVGFTAISSRISSREIVEMLNDVFSRFDALADRYGVEKIKTIGDAYMVAAGLPRPMENHAEVMADFALDMRDALREAKAAYPFELDLRIGMHSGPVVAGVIGRRKFLYDMWGDTVNTASRMESHGIPGRIQVSEDTHRILHEAFRFEARGEIEIKGKGKMRTYFLTGKNGRS